MNFGLSAAVLAFYAGLVFAAWLFVTTPVSKQSSFVNTVAFLLTWTLASLMFLTLILAIHGLAVNW